jgi:hypothetical protein
MKEIKFKVYLGKSNKIMKVHSLHLGTNKVIISSKHGGNYSKKLNEDNKLLNFTGFNSENNEDIYQNDIVGYKDHWRAVVVANEFNDGWEMLECNTGSYIGVLTMGNAKLFKKLGNKYINPELMKYER